MALFAETAAAWNFSLANYDSVWNLVVQICIVLVALFIGNILRNVIPFLKKSLIPSALIGGALLLCAIYFCRYVLHYELVSQQVMQVLTYHGLGIGFVAMSLKTTKARTKLGKVRVVETGLLTGGTYMLQAVVGLGITIVLFLVSGTFYASGLLLPLGFGQGPGNALSWDLNYSEYEAFSGNGSFGLSLASIGFIVASVVGVVFINIQKKRNKRKTEPVAQLDREIYVEDNEIPASESVDKFSIQIGFILIAYLLSFGFMCLLAKISSFTDSLAWGFNFLWGVFAAMLVKAVLRFLQKRKVVKRNYINNYQMDRVSGFAFDIMIVAGVAAIEIKDIVNYILPIVLLSVAGTVVTFIYIRLVVNHCFKGFRDEAFVMYFATYTGTASNGMILLKELDPNLETPVANLYVLSQFVSMLSVAPLLLLLGFAGKSLTNALIALAVFFVLFVAYTVFLFRTSLFGRRARRHGK